MNAQDPMNIQRQCTAKSRSGKQCKRRPIPGGNVCVMHGGKAPQVRNKARERLEALVLPAISVLHEGIKKGDIDQKRKAAVVVLDRTGFRPGIELSGPDGGPIQTQNNSWLKYCTIEEQRIILDIADRAQQRMLEEEKEGVSIEPGKSLDKPIDVEYSEAKTETGNAEEDE